MKSLVESINSNVNEANRDISASSRQKVWDTNKEAILDLVKPIYYEQDIVKLFAKYGIKASVKDTSYVNWEKIDMTQNKKYAKWKKLLPNNLYVCGQFTVNMSNNEFDKLCKMLKNISGTDLIKNLQEKYPEVTTPRYITPKINKQRLDPCFIEDGLARLFIDEIEIDSKDGWPVRKWEAKEIGNGDLISGIKELATDIQIIITVYIDITDVAGENFVYDTTGAGGVNDCTGTPIKVGDIVAYMDRSQLSIGKVISINKNSVTLVTNNTFGDKTDINGKKVHIVK